MHDITLTEVFPCFFLGCKANARVILAKTGHGRHSSKIVVLLYVLFVLYCSIYCLCVNVYCHRVTTQLQLTNISYHKGMRIHQAFVNAAVNCQVPLAFSNFRSRSGIFNLSRIFLNVDSGVPF